jgi:DNA-binding response OmpR family regulator
MERDKKQKQKSKARQHVLLVEDEPLLIDLYEERFAEEPFELSTAETGEDALRLARAGKVDLILLDILLPGINGFEVLRQLKADMETRDIPVIVLTNLGSEQSDKDKQLALSLGAVDYLVKSYHTPDEMVEIITRRLDG